MTPLYVQILLVKLKDDMRQKDVFVLRYKEPVLQKTFMPTTGNSEGVEVPESKKYFKKKVSSGKFKRGGVVRINKKNFQGVGMDCWCTL